MTEKILTKTVAMPADTNPNGDIFGGWLLSQMDVAGGILAKSIAKGRIATVAIEGMKLGHSEMNSDMHASSEYRANLVSLYTKKAVEAC